MAKSKGGPGSGSNFVSEWFGHRVYPQIVASDRAIQEQQAEQCPFLSTALGIVRKCIKSDAARGVCTISSPSNGVRQDWLVCPYRALSDEIVSWSIKQLFALAHTRDLLALPAATLENDDVRRAIEAQLKARKPAFLYFDKKTSGELSIPATKRSPEFAFDVTVIELTLERGHPHIGRFGILEIQTMDFHGSYRKAVRNLSEGLRMHPGTFADVIQANQWWLADGVEGPNIANVFKRTFYQMMFKFELGRHSRCAGCVLAIPKAVWDSWQKHLGGPELSAEPDGTYRLLAPGHPKPDPCPAWIYVFEPDATQSVTPSPLKTSQIIGTDAASISHWALEVAPSAALSNIDAEAGFLAALSRRLKQFWPELAKTALVKAGSTEIPIEELESESSYSGATDNAIEGEPPDED